MTVGFCGTFGRDGVFVAMVRRERTWRWVLQLFGDGRFGRREASRMCVVSSEHARIPLAPEYCYCTIADIFHRVGTIVVLRTVEPMQRICRRALRRTVPSESLFR